MRVILLGPPGCGKGTQAELIQKEFGGHIISAGNLLRVMARRDEKIRAIVECGNLVDSALITEIICQEVGQYPDQLVLLDGFPRNLQQAKLFHQKFPVDLILYFMISVEVLVKRLSQRLFHPGSGRTYHEVHCPPQKEGVDDVTGEPLVRRKDDNREVIENRMQVYQAETMPVVEFYRPFNVPVVELSADQSISMNKERCFEVIRPLL